MKTNEDKSEGGENRQMRLNLVGLTKDDETPNLVVTAIDRSSQPIHVTDVDPQGNFDIPSGVLKKAHRIIIGPSGNDDESPDPENILKYRTSQFIELLDRGSINVAEAIWKRWLFTLRCVTGRTRLCRRRPWWIYDLIRLVKQPQLNFSSRITSLNPSIGLSDSIQLQRPNESLSELIFGRHRCYTICNGTVEVYRRTCCCRPWIIDDLRLPELIRDLEVIVRKIPEVPQFPQFPPLPDPPPIVERTLIKDGTLDELAINAPRDLATIRTLNRPELAEYINARPYLICRSYSCSSPKKVAQGDINPDGRFNICWIDFLTINRPFCHDEYAYIVKQKLGGITFTVYNGVAANKWYHLNDDPILTSYSKFAFACRDNGEPGTGAFVFLDIIGDTESQKLITPNASGWDRVNTPVYNSGLVFPPSTSDEILGKAEAAGANLNRNWGGILKLNYKFSEDLKFVGAKYYRVSVSEADSNGDPTGARNYLSAGLAWDKTVIVGTDVEIQPEILGPVPPLGGNANLFKIPYDADADWNAGQYHGFLNTNDTDWNDPTKRKLVTVEVFDDTGRRLRPTGTSPTGLPGAEIEAAFKYRRRYQDVGPTSVVPYAALTHMFWWDNRELSSAIEHLNLNGVQSLGECQFLEGEETSTLGIGYRAYHPNELFQLSHSISWVRGLGPGAGSLLASSPFNVGQPPAPVGSSPTNTFHQMLHSNPSDPANPHKLKKCAFAVNLGISSKTTDGDSLGNHNITKTAAFALEVK